MNNSKVTKCKYPYPKGYEPDICIPKIYGCNRYAIGKKGNNMLAAICMNPSAADNKSSDKTVNKVIAASEILGCDGWIVFNIYPERATDSSKLNKYDVIIENENLHVIKQCLTNNNIREVWGAWGNLNNKTLKIAKIEVLNLFKEMDMVIFQFAEPTKKGEPRHPTPRGKSLVISNKNKRKYDY